MKSSSTRIGLFAGLCLAMSCSGGGGGGTTTTTGGGGSPVYEPVKVKPLQVPPREKAIIYGTDSSGGSRVVHLSGKRTTRTVHNMAVRVMGGRAQGAMGKTTLTTTPQTERVVRVGFMESMADGVGPQKRAAVWLAAFVSASMLNKDLTDWAFTAEAQGYTDGPSAGALMTAGFLATMTGDPIRADTTMTGMVNPDGTVGPVGGIPQKFSYAISQGKKRLGYPIGLRFAYDMNQRRVVDLEELARSQGATAVEVADVAEAYELLTGKRLPAVVPVSEREMRLGSQIEGQYKRYYEAWKKLLGAQFLTAAQAARAGQLTGGFRILIMLAQRQYQDAERLLQQGLFVSAYDRIIQAVIYGVAATTAWRIAQRIQAGDHMGARAVLGSFERLAGSTMMALERAGGLRPTTMGGHMLMMSSFEKAITGWGFRFVGNNAMKRAFMFLAMMQRSIPSAAPAATPAPGFWKQEGGAPVPPRPRPTPNVDAMVMQNVLPALLTYTRSITHTRQALESLEIEKAVDMNYLCSLPNARRLAESYASAAAANLKYFEAVTIDPMASRAGVSSQKAHEILMQRWPNYLIAYVAQRVGLPPQLKQKWGETSLPASLGRLAGGILSYFKTSALVSKHASLGVKSNKYGTPESVQHRKAFTNMLSTAERKARQHAHSAKIATGSIPIQARIHYQNARVLREGSLADKLRALELFWASSMYSQTAVMLARNPLER